MVKLGSNLCEKPDKEQGTGSGDDFDNIPLITPLDVNQLQQPFPDKVIVKTRTEYQLQQKKKRKLHVPGIKKLNINLYDEVSEKVKGMCPWNECKTQLGLNRGILTSISLMYWGILSIGLVPEAQFPPRIPWDMENSLWHYKNQDLTGLILITMAFLACLLMLVMYKALWYDQLTCPEGFVFKHKHCTPAALEMYYSEQEVGPHGSLYTAINHVNQGKKTIPELPSPWLPVINALKEAEKGKEDPAGVQ